MGVTEGFEIRNAKAAGLLARLTADIVFLDPPFHQNLLAPCLEQLEQQGWLNNPAWIYLEAERDLDPLPLPAHWQLYRSKTAGQVGYHLARREQACEDEAPL